MNAASDHDRGPDDGLESQPDEDLGAPGPYGLDAAVPGRTTPAPLAQPTRVTNRSSSVVVACLMPVALVVGIVFQLGASLQQTFGSGESTPGTTVAVLLGVAIAVGIPAAVLVVEARARRKDRSRSVAAMVSAIVVLCIAGAWNGAALLNQVGTAAENAQRRAQPATAAERHFGDRDAADELGKLGARTAALLQADLDPADAEMTTQECRLRNDEPGRYFIYDLRLPDAGSANAPTAPAPTAEEQARFDAVAAFWSGEGISEDPPSAEHPEELNGSSPWTVRAVATTSGEVFFSTECLADPG
jgi:hypothetical protein